MPDPGVFIPKQIDDNIIEYSFLQVQKLRGDTREGTHVLDLILKKLFSKVIENEGELTGMKCHHTSQRTGQKGKANQSNTQSL